MNSEFWTIDFGSITEARDLVERLPLCTAEMLVRVLVCNMPCADVSVVVNVRLFPLQCRQRVLDLVILGVLESDVVVDAGRFLK